MISHTNCVSRAHANIHRRTLLGPIALILAAFAVLSLSGCVGLTGAGTSAANSTSLGTLAASTATLDFGSVGTGTTSPKTLTLSNTGTATITISQATATGAGFTMVGSMSGVSIAAGQSQGFQVAFAPKSAGAASGSISILSDATNSPMDVPLAGIGTAALSISTQPENQSVKIGQAADFSVVAKGTGTLTYQWKKNGTVIAGATAASYATPAATTADNNAKFTVVVTDSTGSVTSSAAVLTVTATAVAPSITTQPANRTVSAGQVAAFSVTATGTAPLTYQWKKNGAAISGATSSSYTTPAATSSDNNASFTVTVTNSVSSVASSAATLTVNLPTTITAQPASRAVNAGQTATFTVAATGAGTMTYQWKKNGAAISGATSASYTTPAEVVSDNGAAFTVTVAGAGGSVTSNAATLTVSGPPSITGQPANRSVTAGQTATFSVTASGSGTLTYQWKKGGVAVSGATSSSYTTPATTTADSGSQFTVTVTNSVGSVNSNAATLTVAAAGTLILNASQASLSFSNIDIGSNSILPVTFTNGGTANVTISNVSVSGAGFTASGIQSGQIVAPGKTATLNVTFAPSSAGVLPGSVTVTSNATNSPSTITLSGTGVHVVSHSVAITWTASTSAVTGYNVYRSTVSGGPYSKLNSSPVAGTSYTDTTVQASQTYFYVVTSVDSNNVESAFSTEVSASVP
jgi:hypothetical protein